MTEAWTFLLIGSLLQGALCAGWPVSMPQSLKALTGSCVTIPCSFAIEDKYKQDLNKNCEAFWNNQYSFVSDHSELNKTKELTGNLTAKDCTTTFTPTNQMSPSSKYYFRLDCKNSLKYTFNSAGVTITLSADPPSPTLTPSTLEVKEGTSVSLMCSAPALCWPHPPTLTWTPNLRESVETLQENQDKTKTKTSVMNFTASHLHHGMKITCTAVYKKQDGSTHASAETSLTAVISFPPHIQPSSACTTTESQVSCSCETVGNSLPTLLWYLDGVQVSETGRFEIINETLNDTALRSFITANQTKERNIFNLVCHSFNSLGSASQQFCVSSLQSSAEHPDSLLYPVITVILAALLFLLVCVLVFIIRSQKNQHNSKSQSTREINTAAWGQDPIREVNEAPDTTEECIYGNAAYLANTSE